MFVATAGGTFTAASLDLVLPVALNEAITSLSTCRLISVELFEVSVSAKGKSQLSRAAIDIPPAVTLKVCSASAPIVAQAPVLGVHLASIPGMCLVSVCNVFQWVVRSAHQNARKCYIW